MDETSKKELDVSNSKVGTSDNTKDCEPVEHNKKIYYYCCGHFYQLLSECLKKCPC